MIDYFCDRDYAALDPIVARRLLYLVFEYMDTTLWREFQKRKGLFDRQMIIRIFGDVCRGVKHVHDLGIVHTDLSANNLLYSQGRLKVADLGCSSCAATWVLPASERGTAHSRAPELWLAFEGKHASKVPAASQLPLTISTAIDCWSLGVCLGMLLTGQFIFESFADIVSSFGPLTDTEWRGCTSLPGYKTLKVAQLSKNFNGYDTYVLNYFSSAKHVK
jgi:serine/threonine protein kinase